MELMTMNLFAPVWAVVAATLSKERSASTSSTWSTGRLGTGQEYTEQEPPPQENTCRDGKHPFLAKNA